MTPKSIILMALLATTLIATSSATPDKSWKPKNYLELLQDNYEFYIKAKSCVAARTFSMDSLRNAFLQEQAIEIERTSGIMGSFYYFVSVIRDQLNYREKFILFFLATLYASFIFLAVAALVWILEKLFPSNVEVTLTSKQPHKNEQPPRQLRLHMRAHPDQQPEIYYYQLKHTDIKMKPKDAPPAYEKV